jgi:hypothetical protein
MNRVGGGRVVETAAFNRTLVKSDSRISALHSTTPRDICTLLIRLWYATVETPFHAFYAVVETAAFPVAILSADTYVSAFNSLTDSDRRALFDTRVRFLVAGNSVGIGVVEATSSIGTLVNRNIAVAALLTFRRRNKRTANRVIVIFSAAVVRVLCMRCSEKTRKCDYMQQIHHHTKFSLLLTLRMQWL